MANNKEYQRQYYLNNREILLIKSKKYRGLRDKKQVSLTSYKNKLKQLYNISWEQYIILFNKQGGCCAICGKHQETFKNFLCVDHDHESNEVRGLLCHGCNSALGLLGDSINGLNKAVNYLSCYVKI